MTVRWTFEDVWQVGPMPYSYTFEINPNAGGSPPLQKQIETSYSVGVAGPAILQEGAVSGLVSAFAGTIVTQSHLEAMEFWFARRVVLDLTDDLGRVMRGTFSKFAPVRVRKPFDPWYHTYDAEFAVVAYAQANGHVLYGRFV